MMSDELVVSTGDPPTPDQAKNGTVIIDGVLFGEDVQVANWVHQVLKGGIVEVGYCGLGIVPDGLPAGDAPESIRLIGGVYFWGYESGELNDIIASVAVSDELLRDMARYKLAIGTILNYPFGQLKLPRISAEIRMDNTNTIKAAQELGFRLEGRKRKKVKNGTDVGVFGLLAEQATASGYWTPKGVTK